VGAAADSAKSIRLHPGTSGILQQVIMTDSKMLCRNMQLNSTCNASKLRKMLGRVAAAVKLTSSMNDQPECIEIVLTLDLVISKLLCRYIKSNYQCGASLLEEMVRQVVMAVNSASSTHNLTGPSEKL
jgi:hypothetical protein